MKKYSIYYLFTFIMFLIWSACSDNMAGGYEFPYEKPKIERPGAPEPGSDFPTERDIYQWPFDKYSIWNTPIGGDAEYVHAHLEPADAITVDEDYIVLTPNEPEMQIYRNSTGWAGDRCYSGSLTEVLFEAPIPQSWIVSPETWDGGTPNAGIAVVKSDGYTLLEGQPFAHCVANQPGACSYLLHQGHSIREDGIRGAHGGSGLSAIGGALRSHELTPTSGPIRHALKINLFAPKNLYYDATTMGYRWPADRADNYAQNPGDGYGRQRDTDNYPVVTDCRMGALLALPPSIIIDQLGLKTEPGKRIAQALQDYGGYVVDDTAWNVHAIITEWGPHSRFKTEFEKNWGFDFEAWHDQTGTPKDWKTDIDIIFANLHVVVNNTEETIGGPGYRRQPYAPDFK